MFDNIVIILAVLAMIIWSIWRMVDTPEELPHDEEDS